MKILVPTTTQQSNLHQLASGTGFFRAGKGGGGVILCQKEGTRQIQEIDDWCAFLLPVVGYLLKKAYNERGSQAP